MKRTKAQIDNLLDEIARFTIILDNSDYGIDYEPKPLKFSSFERAVNENLIYWRNKGENLSTYTEWKNISDKISRVKEYLETVDDNPQLGDNISNYLYNYLSTNITGDDRKRTYRININSPINSDTSWRSIDRFIGFYLKRVSSGEYLSDAIRAYIGLCKNPTEIGYKLQQSSNYSYYPALFMLKDELSPKNVSIKNFEDKTLHPIREKLEQLVQEAAEGRQEITHFIEEKRGEVQAQIDKNATDMDEYKTKVDTWEEAKHKRLDALEDTYRRKLQLEAPETLWNERSEEYKERAKYWTRFLVGASIVLLFTVAGFIYLLHNFPEGIIKQLPFLPQSVLFIGVISFFVYIVRILVKIVMSNHHVAMEYEQKASLTRFYQALTQDGLEINDNEKLIIMSSLFSKADTGLVKTSESVDLDSVLGLIARNSGK